MKTGTSLSSCLLQMKWTTEVANRSAAEGSLVMNVFGVALQKAQRSQTQTHTENESSVTSAFIVNRPNAGAAGSSRAKRVWGLSSTND